MGVAAIFIADKAAVFTENNLFALKDIDKSRIGEYNVENIIQTVEAEVKVIMLPQRVRVAESRAKNKSSNGPLRVQSNKR
ncbi:MAG: hypothetical protein J6A60_07660 [Clostridia bacterium]|nr:hypothetical protein [Clostridia bacterium]